MIFNFPFWNPVLPHFNIGSFSTILGIAGLIFAIVMLVDCLKRKPVNFTNPISIEGKYDKIIWSLGIVLTLQYWFLGAIVYYFVVKADKGDS